MGIETQRHKLPLLAVGQAQKEYTHNEALFLIDNILDASILSISNDPDAVLSSVDSDQTLSSYSWLVGDEAIGAWTGKADQIAIWSENGWRFAVPLEGMTIYNRQFEINMMYRNGRWIMGQTLNKPAGGNNIDTQARESIEDLIRLLQQFGWIR